MEYAADNGTQRMILIAVDSSEACKKAVVYAKKIFPIGYTYHLVHIQTSADTAALAFAKQHECDELREATAKSFVHSRLLYLAGSAGAAVKFTMLQNHSDSSSHVGALICNFTEKNNPSALIMMRARKSSMTRIFLGSVTTYCAVHSLSPVIIIPE
ncbi:g8910 [Coccomyxa viridis]|uniref:G8910 protein n=1 Tax=Coccomyxa viridis TaxID=1274662 RepID=A0ABP1G1N4_9CHLO